VKKLQWVMPAALVAVAALALTACGNGGKSASSDRLTAAQYRAKLTQLSHEANAAQSAVQQGLKATSVAKLDEILTTFADSAQRLGDEVAAVKAPKNAEAANAELARGEHDTAAATRTAAKKVAGLKSVKAALAYLQTNLGNAKGGRELDDALTKLRKLGYTKGS
jgi:hypothetical protein